MLFLRRRSSSHHAVSSHHVVVFAAACSAVLATACTWYPYDCGNYGECDPGNSCTGQCAPLPPLDFMGPTLLWMGKEAEAPECPARAPRKVYEGHAELDASNQCPTCACSEPACVFPSALTASDSPLCQGPTFTPFEAPGGWDGSCASPTIVTSDLVDSVRIAPVEALPCEPALPSVPHDLGSSPWGKFARACGGEATPNACGDPGMMCLPTAEPPPPGFQQCILYLRDDDPQCPADYPEKFVFYGDLEDTRECTPCECTPTAPSDCLGWLSLYKDEGCTEPVLQTMSGPGEAACVDLQAPSMQLAGMQAEWITNEPGSCVASGGVPSGEAKPLDQRTFCCQPPPG